jgi:two-component system sensor histidine kinase PilS (NtrC family)
VNPAEGRSGAERALARLLVARLGLAAFGVGLALVVAGESRSEIEELGLWAVLAVAFGSTAFSAALMGRVRRVRSFGVAQLGADVAVVTALVHFSGGGASPFGFMYLPITVFGAMLFDRRGAYGAALLASLAYGALLLGQRSAAELEFALWCGHTGALLVVALLASALARELRVTGERLDASRARLRALASLHERTVECLTSGLLTLDASQRVSFVNPEAERIIGRSAPELLGAPLDAVLPGAGVLVESAEAASGRMRSRLQVPGPGGEPRHLGLAVSILRGEEGVEAGHVVIFQDVSAVVRMEQELRVSSRLAGVGELAASIAHEIRNPLAAISGSVELLRGGGAEAERERLMDIVLREIGRLDALIRDFLQFARPAPPKLVAVALPPLLAEVAQMLATAVPPGARLEVEADPAACALADPTQLRQVLWNLARNACDALEGPGLIRLAAARVANAPRDAANAPQGAGGGDRKRPREEAAAVEIVVADTGRGIPLDDLERIFDPFYTTKPDGTGLGLPTVHRIVESHGGALQVESQPGVGTRFRVRLPVAEAPA